MQRITTIAPILMPIGIDGEVNCETFGACMFLAFAKNGNFSFDEFCDEFCDGFCDCSFNALTFFHF